MSKSGMWHETVTCPECEASFEASGAIDVESAIAVLEYASFVELTSDVQDPQGLEDIGAELRHRLDPRQLEALLRGLTQ